MSSTRDYLLFRRESVVVAAAVPHPEPYVYPSTVILDGMRFDAIEDEDTFFFWNDLCDSSGATVGYNFFLPESPTFQASRMIRESANVAVEGGCYEEVDVLLAPCENPENTGTQGFDSVIYVSQADSRDCALFLYDWSKNGVAFPLIEMEDCR